jgi:hypothetical protein
MLFMSFMSFLFRLLGNRPSIGIELAYPGNVGCLRWNPVFC